MTLEPTLLCLYGEVGPRLFLPKLAIDGKALRALVAQDLRWPNHAGPTLGGHDAVVAEAVPASFLSGARHVYMLSLWSVRWMLSVRLRCSPEHWRQKGQDGCREIMLAVD